jgi:hypothetical protein
MYIKVDSKILLIYTSFFTLLQESTYMTTSINPFISRPSVNFSMVCRLLVRSLQPNEAQHLDLVGKTVANARNTLKRVSTEEGIPVVTRTNKAGELYVMISPTFRPKDKI